MLSDGNLDAHSEKDDRIFGTVQVPEGDSVMFTTIPYDAGWKVYVDGTECETKAVVRETLLAFDITPGEHEIELRYRPDCVKYGLILSAAGLVIFAAACVIEYVYKRKHPLPCEEEIADGDFTEVIPDAEIFGEKTGNAEKEEDTDD